MNSSTFLSHVSSLLVPKSMHTCHRAQQSMKCSPAHIEWILLQALKSLQLHPHSMATRQMMPPQLVKQGKHPQMPMQRKRRLTICKKMLRQLLQIIRMCTGHQICRHKALKRARCRRLLATRMPQALVRAALHSLLKAPPAVLLMRQLMHRQARVAVGGATVASCRPRKPEQPTPQSHSANPMAS